ncbi:MAG: cytochrome c biogenesis protein CcsA [Planctomycetia bacterium]|nr:cytochrome c biogenesis protein CcsA [Planctomycetia bacterium]
MLAGISLTCFTASYTVALGLEATRMWFRSGLRGALMLGFGAAGVIAHTLFLGYRATLSTSAAPLSSEFDWYLIAAWALAAVYLGWTFRQLNAPNERRTAVGLFLLPLVLALVAAAQFSAAREPLAREQASGIWLTIHFCCLATGFVSVLLGFATGVMELVQAYRLKHKLRAQQGLRLPSLEWLQQTGLRTLFASFTLLSLGLLTGMILNLVKGQFSWSDPVVWRFGMVVLWLAAASTFVVVYKPARQGRKIAYLTIVSALVVVVSLGLGRLLPSGHGAPKHRSGIAAIVCPPQAGRGAV